MSAMKEVWDALRAVVGIADKMQDLSTEVRELRRENQALRERLVRIETIIEGAYAASRGGGPAAAPQLPSPPTKDR